MTERRPYPSDLTEAVSLDWERIGIKVRRSQGDIGSWLPPNRARKTSVSGFSYSPPSPADDPALSWQRTM